MSRIASMSSKVRALPTNTYYDNGGRIPDRKIAVAMAEVYDPAACFHGPLRQRQMGGAAQRGRPLHRQPELFRLLTRPLGPAAGALGPARHQCGCDQDLQVERHIEGWIRCSPEPPAWSIASRARTGSPAMSAAQLQMPR
ncbi:hypothetical protein [Streptomyces canus]|uniref:hypothetical protein n=1 Tax=Streptomyces canus TaxID=58343 RepID=UPI00074A85CA|nr:hypothetical protein [Streptomyces canus]KUN12581.1 hypothetical protein AQI96_15445 [Streptomyces canus]